MDKACKCGKRMILRFTNRVLTSYPAQYPQEWWCGGCGAIEDGSTVRGKTSEELDMENWKNINNGD